MAEYGEWNKKGATLSEVTAKTEYGVSREFIVKGIKAGSLEYRDGVMWGNPYLRILRSQLEKFIADELGEEKNLTLTELCNYVQRDITALCRAAERIRVRGKSDRSLEERIAAIRRQLQQMSECQA